MSMLFTLLILGGDTLTLTNGEIFVGKVVAQNEQRLWLKLEKGGVLTFPRDRIAKLDAADTASPAPAAVRTPAPESRKGSSPAAAPAKMPGGKAAPTIAVVTQKDMGRYALKCPAGFEKDPAAPPPFVCVLNEPATGARMTLWAESFDKGIEDAAEKVRAEIGAGLVAEQEFRLRDAEISGRLFESEVVSERETRGELQVVFVRDGVLFKLGGGVRKDRIEQYRDLFHEVFAGFKLAPAPPDRSAGALPAAGKETRAPKGAPRAAVAPGPPPPKEQPR